MATKSKKTTALGREKFREKVEAIWQSSVRNMAKEGLTEAELERHRNNLVLMSRGLVSSDTTAYLEARRQAEKSGPAYWEKPGYFKRLRKEVGLSQHELARATGISRSVIANYETGVTGVSTRDSFKICEALLKVGSLEVVEEVAKTLVHLSIYEKDLCLSFLKSTEAELDFLKKRREDYEKRIAHVQEFLESPEAKRVMDGESDSTDRPMKQNASSEPAP